MKRESIWDREWETVGLVPSTWGNCLGLALYWTISTHWHSRWSPLYRNKLIKLLWLITDKRDPALPMLQLLSHWNMLPMFGFAFICSSNNEALELCYADNKTIHLGCSCPWVCPHVILFIPFVLPWLCGFLHLLEQAVQPPVLTGRLNWWNICFF